jgi:DNA-binding NarL/FixJ family response regulator
MGNVPVGDDGKPGAEQRRTTPTQDLVRVARLERQAAGREPPPDPYVRLRALEHPRVAIRRATVVSADPLVPIDGDLTAKQRELVDALVAAPSVSAAAAELGMSRSNVYASLRRVGRKVGVTDVSELLRRLRAGRFDSNPGA